MFEFLFYELKKSHNIDIIKNYTMYEELCLNSIFKWPVVRNKN